MKILFFIHDLGQGGAEKVLVNLVNHLDPSKFDISVCALFGGGVNEQFLKEHIHYSSVFPRMIPGNSHLMKLFSPRTLHKMFVREHYDVEIAYLEGPDARIIGGCPDKNTKKLCWIHSMQLSKEQVSASFRSLEEAKKCYSGFDRVVCVSSTVEKQFLEVMPVFGRTCVQYNTNDSETILNQADEPVEEGLFSSTEFKLVGVGKLVPVKAFERLISVTARLRENGIPAHLYLLGQGPEKDRLSVLACDAGIADYVSFLGYQTNPYRYLRQADLFVCSSFSEGFSTATTEALIVGTPVCTTEVSGMREMLGDSKYGLIVENNEEALYQGIKQFLDDPELLAHYRTMARERAFFFSAEHTVLAVEKLLTEL